MFSLMYSAYPEPKTALHFDSKDKSRDALAAMENALFHLFPLPLQRFLQ